MKNYYFKIGSGQYVLVVADSPECADACMRVQYEDQFLKVDYIPSRTPVEIIKPR